DQALITSVLQDAREQRDRGVDRPPRERAGLELARRVGLHVRAADVAQQALSERRDQMVLQLPPVVPDRLGTPAGLVQQPPSLCELMKRDRFRLGPRRHRWTQMPRSTSA